MKVTSTSFWISICLLTGVLLPFNGMVAQGCSVDNEVVIQAFETTDIVLSIENLLNEDLGVDQGVCGIRIAFEHSQLDNIRITLTSPAGDQVTLIGPGTTGSDITDLITWNIGFTECMNPTAPDAGFTGQWQNGQNWESLNTYTGTYHPFSGCLEDFDSGSANGNWLLQIENLGPAEGTLFYFEIILCNDTGNDCNSCYLDAGNFSEEFAIFCEKSPELAQAGTLNHTSFVVGQDQELAYLLLSGDDILSWTAEINQLDTLPPGQYRLCGLAFESEDRDLLEGTQSYSAIETLIDNRTICADRTDDCFTISVRPAENELFIDTLFCRGDTLSIRGVSVYENLDTIVTVYDTLPNQAPGVLCDSLIHIRATVVDIEARITAPTMVVNCGKTIFLNANSSTSSPVPVTSYQWDTQDGALNNNFGPIAGVTGGGRYVLVTDNGVCQDSSFIDINATSDFSVDVEVLPVFCDEDPFEVMLTAQPEPDSFEITGPGAVAISGSVFTTFDPGMYVVVSYYGQCTDMDTIDLVDTIPALTLDLETDTIDCGSAMAEITISTNAEMAEWTFDGPENIPDNEPSPEVTTPGLYSVTLTDGSGCMISSSIEVVQDINLPMILTANITRNCNDPPVALPLDIDSPYDSVVWRFPDGTLVKEENPEAFDAGLYEVSVFGVNGCVAQGSLMLEVTNIMPDFFIEGDSLDCLVNLVSLCAEGDYYTDSISWQMNGVQLGSGPCIQVSEPGLYQLTVFDENGCSGQETYDVVDIAFDPDLAISASASALGCSVDSIMLTAEPANQFFDGTYEWTGPDNMTQGTPGVIVTQPGTYHVTLTDNVSGCSDSDSINILELPDPFTNVQLTAIDPDCGEEMGAIFFDNLPNDTNYDIFVNDNLVGGPISQQNVVPGTYEVEIISAEGCIFDTTLSINADIPVMVDLGEDIPGVLGQQIDLNVNLNIPLDQLSDMQWSHPEILSCLDCLNPVVTVTGDELLTLQVTDLNGCRASDQVYISVDRNIDLFIPNIFTPNGDGDNDELTLYLSDSVTKIFDIRIIDRWGNLLFFHPEITNEVNNFSWDGTFNGYRVGSGVYIFMAKLLLVDNTETILVQDITLLR